jgi:hypothetical protein
VASADPQRTLADYWEWLPVGSCRPCYAPAVLWLICLGVLATPVAAQLPNQSFEVVPEVAHATVGDHVSLRFRVRLDERDLLYDSVPKPMTDLAEGVRILSVEKLRRGPDRIYTGRAQLAFYRIGRRAVPVFGLPFMRAVKGVTRAMLASDSAFVEIDSVAPPGNPALKDIKEIERQRGPDPRLVAAVVAAAALAGLALLLRRRRRLATPSPAAPEPAAPAPVVLGPYEVALVRLTRIDRECWPLRDEVDRHFEAVADVLRRYLEEAHGVPALERTTAELVWALPPILADAGLRERCAALLGEADLVKFARAWRDAQMAATFARDARALLDEWHAAVPESQRWWFADPAGTAGAPG